VVRADWFNQNFDEGFLRDAVRTGEVVFPVGQMKQVLNDAEDIAAVMAAALTRDGHAGQVYELSGPDALSFGQACQILSDVCGYPVRFSGEASRYREVMTGLGLDEHEVTRQVAAFQALADTGDAEVTDVVERVTGRSPISFQSYARVAAQHGAWQRSPRH
jgi:uncharacterized protein YbjT (DUF2867 family)